MDFNAEIKEIKAKKLASLDMSYRIILETSDPAVLALGTIEGDKLVAVTINVESGE
jgi:hypothetical protein